MDELVNVELLEQRLSDAIRRYEEASKQVAEAQMQIAALTTIRDNARWLAPEVEGASGDDDRSGDAALTGLGGIGSSRQHAFLSGSGQLNIIGKGVVSLDGRTLIDPPEPKKVRSTQMVAEIVNSSASPMSVEGVLKEFALRFGIPAAWGNPRNAVNTALNRAASKGLISTISNGLFAPPITDDEAAITLMGGPNG